MKKNIKTLSEYSQYSHECVIFNLGFSPVDHGRHAQSGDFLRMRDGDDNLELRGDQYVVRLLSARHDYENTQICQESLRQNTPTGKRKETHGSAAVPNVTKGKRNAQVILTSL